MFENNKRIAKNTLMLYFRMLIIMGVSLYTSRVVLNTLGVENYGIYSVVGGIVLMFSSIKITMATAVQRFLNFEMGRNDSKKLNDVFSTSVIIHVGIAIIAFILLETIGRWFLNHKMNISPERMIAANWVLQFSILSFIVGILSVPYNAAIIANEQMKAFALISILEACLKLLVVLSLGWFGFDKLKVYAVLMFLVSLVLRVIYGVYAKSHFNECKFKWNLNKALCKEMTSFAGWNMIGVTSTLIRTQGVNIVLNLFFGVLVNAAMGIANQVTNAIQQFTNNFLTALNPQITKSYASKNFSYLKSLAFRGSRFAFYLLLFISLPILVETDYLLKLWLKNVPDYAVIFVRLALIISIVESLSKTLIQAMFATGKIKTYQIVVGSVTFLNLPVSMLFLYWGYPPQVIMIVGINIAVLSLFVRLIMLRRMIKLSIKAYVSSVLFNVIVVSALSPILPILTSCMLQPGAIRFLLVGVTSVICMSFMVYQRGLTSREKVFIRDKFGHKVVRLCNCLNLVHK